MKKKICLLLCMIFAVSALVCGCGSKDSVEYDETSASQFAEWMIQFCASTDDQAAQQLGQMRESVLEQQLAGMGIPATPEALLAAIDAWDAGEKECGEYVGHGEYTYKATAKELHIMTEAQFTKRDAKIEIVLDDELYLDSITVGAVMSTGEILQKAGLNTLLGMGTVFVVLIIISVIISLFRFIPDLQKKDKKQSGAEKPAAASEAAAPQAEEVQTDDAELIAVIAAAIAAAEGTSTDGFVVRSIKRRKSNRW